MATVAHGRNLGARKKRPASTTIGRPKIEGLVPFNLRLLAEDRAALVGICAAEKEKRGDPGLTVTDLIREVIRGYVRGYAP